MTKIDSVNNIDLSLDKKSLDIIIETFSYMIENYRVAGVIDHGAWIIKKEDIEEFVAKLQPYVSLNEDIVVIPMTNDDWNTYTGLVDYAGYVAPEQEDRTLLEDLYDSYMEDDVPTGMEVKKYHDGVVYIEMSREDLKILIAILDQINIINEDRIQLFIPYDHPELTHLRVADLKQQLMTAENVSSFEDIGTVDVGLSETAIIDLSAILCGAYSIDEDFTVDGKIIDEDSIGQFDTEIWLICEGLRTEEEIKLVEQEQGIDIPRYK